jgi:hypothetical protein
MAFFARIQRRNDPLETLRVELMLTVRHATGTASFPFRFDTAFGVTTVSEVVARILGVSLVGARPVEGPFPAGARSGLLARARFRFPTNPETMTPGLELESDWLVLPLRYELAQLGLRDVHPHFTVATDDTFIHFSERA